MKTHNGAMKISMDPAKNRVVEFYEVMRQNGDIAADAPDGMGAHVDATIYYDALQEMRARYPEDAHLQEMLERYEGNNL